MTASQRRAGSSVASQRRRTPATARSPDCAARLAHQVHLDAFGPGELRGQQADGPGAENQQPIARRQAGGPYRPQRVAARLDHRAGGVVDASGSANSAGAGRRVCSASAPANPPRMPISNAVCADVVPPGPAALAVPAADHRVAGDPAAEPARVDAGADRRTRRRTTRDPAASGTPRGPGAGRPSRR